jgi:hypothetical protein
MVAERDCGAFDFHSQVMDDDNFTCLRPAPNPQGRVYDSGE